MKADTLITGISQLVTSVGAGPKHGSAMRELKIIESAAIAISSGLIAWTGAASEWTGMAETSSAHYSKPPQSICDAAY